MKRLLAPASLLALAVLAGWPLPAARAEDITATATPSDPSKPCTLQIRVARGKVQVQGADTRDITVVSDSTPDNKVRKDGLRVLTSAASYSLTEKNNVIVLKSDNGGVSGAGGNFKITVPRNTALMINDLWGGSITCADVSGDVDIRSHNGAVRLSNVSGGATVETMNGEIDAQIAALRAQHPLCFTSMNGKVEIRLPVAAQGNVRLRTQNGAILTDFDEKALITKTEVTASKGMGVLDEKTRDEIRDASRQARDAMIASAQAMREAANAMRAGLNGNTDAQADSAPAVPLPPLPPLPPMTGGKIISGTLNGGGVDIQAATMNGDVILRKG